MLYHSGARNYSCELCGNKFFQMEHLKRHMQSIHNIIMPPSAPTANDPLVECVKRPSKSAHKVGRQKQRGAALSKKSDDFQEGLFHQGPVITTISTELDLSSSGYQQPQCFKIGSHCMLKCQQCEFSSVKLYKLNEHVLNKHSSVVKDLTSSLQMVDSDSFLSDELSFNEFESEVNESSDDLEDAEDRIYNGSSSSNEQVQILIFFLEATVIIVLLLYSKWECVSSDSSV